VRGILSWAGTTRAIAAKQASQLPWHAARHDDSAPEAAQPPRKVAIISQTTKNVHEFMAFTQDVMELAAGKGGEVRVCNTICQPTAERQNALHTLAQDVDALVVVGGRKSSNTTRLAEVGRSYGIPSYHIERAEEIDDSWLEDIERVGITAGASTPDDVIISVIDALQIRGYASPTASSWSEALEEVPVY
jgi:4-hydroxy-3-methylbut-2-enyl diphosphate reductase